MARPERPLNVVNAVSGLVLCLPYELHADAEARESGLSRTSPSASQSARMRCKGCSRWGRNTSVMTSV